MRPDPFRFSDVALWAGIALGCVLFALLGIGVSTLVPDALAGLGRARGEVNPTGLSARIAGLERQIGGLGQRSAELETRFAEAEGRSGALAERVGALQSSLPGLVAAEAEKAAEAAIAQIDLRTTTAAIAPGDAPKPPAEGGTISVRQIPLLQAMAEAAGSDQPLPPPPRAWLEAPSDAGSPSSAEAGDAPAEP